jgi:hypothetical protein
LIGCGKVEIPVDGLWEEERERRAGFQRGTSKFLTAKAGCEE